MDKCTSTEILRARQALAGACAGYAAGATTDAVFYVVDAYKTQAQAGVSGAHSLRQLTRGLVPLSLAGSAPSMAVFFLAYQPLKEVAGSNAVAVAVCSAAATVPATLVYVPSDIIKKQVVTGVQPDVRTAVRSILASQGVRGLWVGTHANLMKDIPFATVKMSLYEGMLYVSRRIQGKTPSQLTASDSAVVGFASGAITAVATNPIDVVNTRLKMGAAPSDWSVRTVMMDIMKREGVKTLFTGLPARLFTIGFGSSLFWSVYAEVHSYVSSSSESFNRAQ
ncbi:hypothetical protein CYMTET_56075 [Cymbomonas tetramitiformis]|uniref:Mitochondrial carrier protein n=1 Tax=Cymbomonas tetramitiformis TaxID=36881 RepID=A0AAE0EMQ4_9CHLO|nr:hypothetical protein CYMTET_56075 [Cymbomonas tetramitiformis]